MWPDIAHPRGDQLTAVKNRVSADQYRIAGSDIDLSRLRVLSADKLPAFNWSQAQLQMDFFAIYVVTSLLFDLKYKFINGSFAFSTG